MNLAALSKFVEEVKTVCNKILLLHPFNDYDDRENLIETYQAAISWVIADSDEVLSSCNASIFVRRVAQEQLYLLDQYLGTFTNMSMNRNMECAPTRSKSLNFKTYEMLITNVKRAYGEIMALDPFDKYDQREKMIKRCRNTIENDIKDLNRIGSNCDVTPFEERVISGRVKCLQLYLKKLDQTTLDKNVASVGDAACVGDDACVGDAACVGDIAHVNDAASAADTTHVEDSTSVGKQYVQKYNDMFATIQHSCNDALAANSEGGINNCLTTIQECMINFNIIMTNNNTPVAVRRCIQSKIPLLHLLYNQLQDTIQQRNVSGGALHEVHPALVWQNMENAFNNNIQTGCIVNHRHRDLKQFLSDAYPVVAEKLQIVLQNMHSIKVYMSLLCKFQNIKSDSMIEETKSFQTTTREILLSTSIEEWYEENVINPLVKKIEDFEDGASGWSLREILTLTINICKHSPLQAGISTFVDIPKNIQLKKAVLNLENRDEHCFLWSIIAALYPPRQGSNSRRTSSYPHYSEKLRYEGIKFPIVLRDIPKFERMNELRINVYGLDEEDVEDNLEVSRKSIVIPVYLSKENLEWRTIHLLMI